MAEAAADGEEKPVKFNPAEFKWTVTNRRAKNMPQLFKDFKGSKGKLETRPSDSFAGS